VTGDPATVVAAWTKSTWYGTRREALTADGWPPIGETRYYEGEDASDCNPICHCPRTPSSCASHALAAPPAGSAVARASSPRIGSDHGDRQKETGLP